MEQTLICNSADDPMTAPDTPQDITIQFERGIPIKHLPENREITDSLEPFVALNAIGKTHGIGRIDMLRFVVYGVITVTAGNQA